LSKGSDKARRDCKVSDQGAGRQASDNGRERGLREFQVPDSLHCYDTKKREGIGNYLE
jgi:hypothetical protein